MENRSQRVGLLTAILAGGPFLAGLDLFIVNVAFDEIGRDLGAPDLAELSWVLNAYTVTYAALLVPMGRLTDRYGRKGGFLAGLAVFTLASLACGFAGSVWTLVGLRVLQAAGAAAMTPASLGLLLAALPPDRRAAGARVWAMTGAVAAALGPAIGGGLVQLSWRWAFWINVPVGAVLIVATLRRVPDVQHNKGTPRPDLLGAAGVAAAVGLLVLGLVQGNEWGWTSPAVVGCFVGAAAATAGFAWLVTHHRAPVVDPALLRARPFALVNLSSLVFNAGFAAALLMGVLWLQQAWGYSALWTGLAIAPGPLCVPVASLLAARLLPRVRPARLIAAGCLAVTAATIWLAMLLDREPAYLSTFLPGWLLIGVGVGLAMPNLVAAATATLPPEQTATGSGVVTMSRQIGIAVGVSVLVSIIGTAPTDAGSVRTAWVFVAVTAAAAAVVMETTTRRRAAPVRDASVRSRA